MRIPVIGLIALGVTVSALHAQSQSNTRPTIANEEDFRRAMKELSNWGRWGDDDELGAANLITPAKRKEALALAKEGVAISLAHDVAQEKAADAPFILERTLNDVTVTGTTDRYQYTGTYHGVVHSHLDAVDCHIMYEGKGYNGRSMEDVKTAGGCPKGNITALKDGVVTRAILFDATLLPGKAAAEGWIEPGTPIHREDLETLEKLEHVKVAPGDVILLYTGRWKRRAEKDRRGSGGTASKIVSEERRVPRPGALDDSGRGLEGAARHLGRSHPLAASILRGYGKRARPHGRARFLFCNDRIVTTSSAPIVPERINRRGIRAVTN